MDRAARAALTLAGEAVGRLVCWAIRYDRWPQEEWSRAVWLDAHGEHENLGD